MATEAVSANESQNRQSFNNEVPIGGSSGSGVAPLRKVQQFPKHDTVKLGEEGNFVPNPDFLVHKQQDKLLAFWLLSTICDEVLVHLTNARTSFDIWSTVTCRFASKSGLTVSTLRHSLYSQKKGQLTMKDYLAKVKSLCDALRVAGNDISEQEQISIILTGLSVEFESIRMVASAMRVSLDLLAEMLTDCKARQQELLSNVSFQANLVQQHGNTDETSSK
ncbi:hypothetical protein Goshw_015694, partial [Gossypium schwendimanii]|nr:hypothetical protein [Gossypium schwendimanii]